MESGLCRSHLLRHYLNSSDAGPEQLPIYINISGSWFSWDKYAHLSSSTVKMLQGWIQVSIRAYTEKLFMLCRKLCQWLHSFILRQISSAHIHSFFLGPGNRALNKKKVLSLWGLLFSVGLRGWADRCSGEHYADKVKQGMRDRMKVTFATQRLFEYLIFEQRSEEKSQMSDDKPFGGGSLVDHS